MYGIVCPSDELKMSNRVSTLGVRSQVGGVTLNYARQREQVHAQPAS